jgi:hypothetical protein
MKETTVDTITRWFNKVKETLEQFGVQQLENMFTTWTKLALQLDQHKQPRSNP